MEYVNMQSTEVNELYAALAKAQGEMKAAIKDSTNPHFKSNFASLAATWDAARDALAKNGLTVIQTPIVKDGGNYLLTTLGHTSGQFIRAMCPLLMARNDAQSFGASLTYFRRFSLAAMVGICPEDDDGEKEREKAEKEAQKAKQQSFAKPTLQQVDELKLILANCSQEYQTAMVKGIAKRGWNGYADMPLHAYLNLREQAIQADERNIKRIVEAVTE